VRQSEFSPDRDKDRLAIGDHEIDSSVGGGGALLKPNKILTLNYAGAKRPQMKSLRGDGKVNIRERKISEVKLERSQSMKTKKTSFLKKCKVKLVRKLLKWRNPFIFASITELYKGVVEKNHNIVEKEARELDYTTFKDLNKLNETIDYIERFYLKMERTTQENPGLDLSQNIKKLEKQGFLNNPGETPMSLAESRPHSFSRTVIALQRVEPKKSKVEPIKSVWHHHAMMTPEEKFAQNKLYEKYSFWKVIKLILEVWLSSWELFCYFLLVIYQIYSQGLLMIFVPFAIFCYALTEETRPRFKFWTVLFSFIVAEILLKFSVQYFFSGTILSPTYQTIKSDILAFTGPQESFVFEIILVIVILIQMFNETKSGFEACPEIIIENVNQAFIRVKIIWFIKNLTFFIIEKDQQ